METLEIVKHFFDIKNVVFIFAVDLEQLSHSIATMYGSGMDSAGYLRRFFDFIVKIPIINISAYLENELGSVFTKTHYQSLLLKQVIDMISALKLSLRDSKKILDAFMLFRFYYSDMINIITDRNDYPMSYGTQNYDSASNDYKIVDSLLIYLYFIIMKYKYPDVYSILINEKFAFSTNNNNQFKILDAKYFNFSNLINDIVISLSQKKSLEQRNKFPLFDVNVIKKNSTDTEFDFSKHIELTIEMFV